MCHEINATLFPSLEGPDRSGEGAIGIVRFPTLKVPPSPKKIPGKIQAHAKCAVEDLSGIRDEVTARKAQRNRLHNWSFGQLRSFVSYKSLMYGVDLHVVDPRNTSRTCPECGCVDKKNRKTQETFSCIVCGYIAMADYVAARNIAKVVVNRPEFSTRRKTG